MKQLAVLVVLVTGCMSEMEPDAAEPTAAPDAAVVTTTGDEESLTAAMIRAGMDPVKPTVEACADHATTGGIVKVRVTVAPDGSVSSAIARTDSAIKGTPAAPPDLANCAAQAVARAKFAPTRSGGNFSYPFVFDI